ncbi:MAG TPA: Gfo/Idh/MocA family oxidoreductase [Abditibacteriaceae bacterium]|jgi:predicted dehydrogenase
MQVTAFLGVAHIHTPNFVNRLRERTVDVTVKAVYDHDAARAAKTAGQLNTSVASVEEILADAEITSVIICSETVHHRDLVEKAAAAGKHIFVEKPLGTSREDADAMEAAIQKAGVVFQTGFFRRSDPVWQFIKQEISAGHLGKITRMRDTNCHQGALGGWFDTDWRWITVKEEAGGGGFADLGAHSLDVVLWCLSEVAGGPCGNVKTAVGAVGAQLGRYPNIDEYGAGIITFESGTIAVVEASWVDEKLQSGVEVNGLEGQIHVKDNKVFYYSKHVEGADGGQYQGELPAAAPHAFELFFDKLEGKELAVALVSVEEAAQESRVMADFYASAA